MHPIISSIIAGLCTGIGTLPLLFIKSVPKSVEDTLLGFSAGIMIFAGSFSLVTPALKTGNTLQVILGILVGAILMAIVEKTVPHLHLDKIKVLDFNDEAISKAALLIAGIIIHSIPEGASIAIGYGAGSNTIGLIMTISIAIQNAPEGLVVTAPIRQKGHSKAMCIGMGFIAGIGQPLGALLGVLLVNVLRNYFAFIMCLAAGGMFYVVSHELIPESHCNSNQMKATFGVIAGFITMLIVEFVVKFLQ